MLHAACGVFTPAADAPSARDIDRFLSSKLTWLCLSLAPLRMPNTLVLALAGAAALLALERFVEFRRATRRVKGWPGFKLLFNFFVPLPWEYVRGVSVNWGYFSEHKFKRARSRPRGKRWLTRKQHSRLMAPRSFPRCVHRQRSARMASTNALLQVSAFPVSITNFHVADPAAIKVDFRRVCSAMWRLTQRAGDYAFTLAVSQTDKGLRTTLTVWA